MEQADLDRLNSLRARRSALDLSDAELLELYRLEWELAPNAYGKVVAVLSTFPPYLDARPRLIPAFIKALYQAASAAHRGLKTGTDLLEYLESKSQVDDDLQAALRHHRVALEEAIRAVAP